MPCVHGIYISSGSSRTTTTGRNMLACKKIIIKKNVQLEKKKKKKVKGLLKSYIPKQSKCANTCRLEKSLQDLEQLKPEERKKL